MSIRATLRAPCTTVAVAFATAFAGSAVAAPLQLSDAPLFVQESVAPLNMLVIGRDHKLYYEAYNDYTDLNGDGVLDFRYKPDDIDYYGYFDSFKCYTYSTEQSRFNPARATEDKTCGGNDEWSGDFLNYLTTTRLDALRKVLYGGYRSSDPTDAAGTTVLERSRVPQDAHSWGKEYTSFDVDGYDIRDYTPYSAPTTGTRHLFANTTLLNTTNPLLRVLTNRSERIWNWVSIERPVAGSRMNHGGSGLVISPAPTDLVVRVAVCRSGLLEANCQRYPSGGYKPIGLLHEFGENDSMLFGLITGSYAKNTSGGVLRREISSIREEIDPANGAFRGGVYKDDSLTQNQGIITTLNRLRTTGFGDGYDYDCGWITTRPINEGECQMWGNPVAEMMYESLRYFAGLSAPTADFAIDYGDGEEAKLAGGGLPVATWDDPYENRPVCAKPFQTVVSDINPSYDSDQIPGTAFGEFSGDLDGLDVSSIGQTIWNTEFGGARSIFIGQSGGVSDGAPTPKTVTSFGNIRGLSPEEPTKLGSYYSASVAYHGFTTDLNDADGDQKVSTFAVALASPLPKISIPVNGRTITLVPFAKSVAGSSINRDSSFQPTDQIVDFYVDTLTDTYGKFRVNFEDVEQGADHDMDAIVIYEYEVVGSEVEITLTSEYAAGGITQHMGYVISGTTHDGIYLEVLDRRDGDTANDVDYRLDTPPEFEDRTPPAPASGTGTWDDDKALPFVTTRTFTPGTSDGATVLKDPLWYAAKWGGFEDGNGNALPDQTAEWDSDDTGVDPDNYFLVTNALTLSQQLREAFDEIIERTASASSASVNSGSVSSNTRVYQAKFNSASWAGQLLSYPVKTDGTLDLSGANQWDAATKVPAADSRKIITANSDGTPVAFQWNALDDTRKYQIEPTYEANETLGINRLAYLRGVRTHEKSDTNASGIFRERTSLLGDIVSSSPLFVGAPFYSFPDDLETKPYSAFRTTHANRTPVVYAGANDGMLHAFHAETGVELLGFVPSAVYKNSRLRSLSQPTYSHKFFVDGAPNMRDAYFANNWHTVLVGGLNRGGQEVYALDITSPASFSEANAASLLLWEFTDRDDASDGITGDADLGYTYSQPAVVRLQNGRWAAIFGNGYNNTENDGSVSATGNAVLYIVDIEDGTLIKKIDTLEGMNDDPLSQNRPNGLGTPAIVDLNGDRIVDYVYAGDLFGNMWKFDIRHKTDLNEWKVAYGTAAAPLPLFTAKGSQDAADADDATLEQPITSRPEVVRGPRGVGMMVLFGTGKYLETGDKVVDFDAPEIQTYYGIWDRNSGTDTDRVANRTELQKQEILLEQAATFNNGEESVTQNIRVTSDHDLGTGKDGWYIDLLSPSGYQGERQVSNTTVRGTRVIFTTLIPEEDPCGFGGNSWLMELDTLSGARLAIPPYDQNGDGLFDEQDMVEVTIGGETVRVPVTGLQPQVGITPDAGFLFGEGASLEYVYLSGTTGDINVTVGSVDPRARGRQSWRQVR